MLLCAVVISYLKVELVILMGWLLTACLVHIMMMCLSENHTACVSEQAVDHLPIGFISTTSLCCFAPPTLFRDSHFPPLWAWYLERCIERLDWENLIHTDPGRAVL